MSVRPLIRWEQHGKPAFPRRKLFIGGFCLAEVWLDEDKDWWVVQSAKSFENAPYDKNPRVPMLFCEQLYEIPAEVPLCAPEDVLAPNTPDGLEKRTPDSLRKEVRLQALEKRIAEDTLIQGAWNVVKDGKGYTNIVGALSDEARAAERASAVPEWLLPDWFALLLRYLDEGGSPFRWEERLPQYVQAVRGFVYLKSVDQEKCLFRFLGLLLGSVRAYMPAEYLPLSERLHSVLETGGVYGYVHPDVHLEVTRSLRSLPATTYPTATDEVQMHQVKVTRSLHARLKYVLEGVCLALAPGVLGRHGRPSAPCYVSSWPLQVELLVRTSNPNATPNDELSWWQTATEAHANLLFDVIATVVRETVATMAEGWEKDGLLRAPAPCPLSDAEPTSWPR